MTLPQWRRCSRWRCHRGCGEAIRRRSGAPRPFEDLERRLDARLYVRRRGPGRNTPSATPTRTPLSPCRATLRSRRQGRGDARRVERVVPADDRQHPRRVAHGRRERPDLVEARRKGDEPVAADAAVGRLHADDAAERCRLADAAAGVAAEGYGAIRAATAAAEPPLEPPGMRRDVPGVGGRAEGASFPSRTPWRTRPCWSCR